MMSATVSELPVRAGHPWVAAGGASPWSSAWTLPSSSAGFCMNCTVALEPSLPKGGYDVIVTNSDGGVGKLAQGFTLQ